jgi:hypothetical protein
MRHGKRQNRLGHGTGVKGIRFVTTTERKAIVAAIRSRVFARLHAPATVTV